MRDAERPDQDLAGDPAAATVSRLVNRQLYQALTELTPDQRDCIILRFLLNQSIADTAEIMGKERGAIKALQYRAIRVLGERLPERGDAQTRPRPARQLRAGTPLPNLWCAGT